MIWVDASAVDTGCGAPAGKPVPNEMLSAVSSPRHSTMPCGEIQMATAVSDTLNALWVTLECYTTHITVQRVFCMPQPLPQPQPLWQTSTGDHESATSATLLCHCAEYTLLTASQLATRQGAAFKTGNHPTGRRRNAHRSPGVSTA